MTTYNQTAYNDFDTPAGVLGEKPDVAGDLEKLADEVDKRIGIGGAEFCNNYSEILALPASRLFPGKLAYNAFSGNVHRYNGSAWKFWEGTITWTPTWTNLTIGSGSTVNAVASIAAGNLAMVNVRVTAGTGFALASGSNDVLCSLPTELQGVTFGLVGAGAYALAGTSTPFQLQAEAANSAIRIRVLYAAATGTEPLYRALTTSWISGSGPTDVFRFIAIGSLI